MPPKTRHTKEAVIEAAVRVVDQTGLRSLTARSVAAALGTSTAPVYSQFATMEELALAVVRETQKQLLEYTRRPYTERVFLNMGTGVCMFAIEHPLLYRALLLEGNSFAEAVREFLETLESEVTKDNRFTALSAAQRRVLLTKMWTFTHGLASLISVGLIKDSSQEDVVGRLVDVGADVIGATLAKHGKGAQKAPQATVPRSNQPRPKERRRS